VQGALWVQLAVLLLEVLAVLLLDVMGVNNKSFVFKRLIVL
jgi:hypothetical protein